MQLGDDAASLRILAIELQDMVGAEQYCAEAGARASGGQASYALLLDLLLHPGPGRAPLFAQACHLLAAQSTAPGMFAVSQLVTLQPTFHPILCA